jgi:predicted nucleotidyltransferase
LDTADVAQGALRLRGTVRIDLKLRRNVVSVIVMLTLETIQRVVQSVAAANGAQMAVLFGSYARGTATDRSDVDLIFVEETEQPFLKRLDRYFGVLFDRLGTGVEVFVYTPHEFQKMKGRPFVRRALKEGMVLFESGRK